MEDSDHLLSEIIQRNTKNQGKQRAKEHRERKKRYIENLDSQIVQLKAQVASLQAENKKLAEEAKNIGTVPNSKGIDCLLQKLEDELKYSLEILPEMLKNDSKEVRFSMIEQTSDALNSCRVQLIKK